MGLLSAGITDIGQKRKTNQDSIYMNPEKHLFIVADGMGGHNGGDIASAMAIKHVPEYIIEHYNDDPLLAAQSSVQAANFAIKRKSETSQLFKGMGTTTVSLYFKGSNVYIANVGDSRAYLVHKHKLFQLSKDHSLVQEKINLGIYTREDGARDPNKNVLVRAVGFEEDVNIDVFTYKVCRGDLFFICSDGLHGMIHDSDILEIINHYIKDPLTATSADLEKTVKVLVNLANNNGGNDNISLIMIIAR